MKCHAIAADYRNLQHDAVNKLFVTIASTMPDDMVMMLNNSSGTNAVGTKMDVTSPKQADATPGNKNEVNFYASHRSNGNSHSPEEKLYSSHRAGKGASLPSLSLSIVPVFRCAYAL